MKSKVYHCNLFAKLLTGMPVTRRRFLSAATAGALAAPLATAASRPALVVWIFAEQFRPDYLDQLWSAFEPGGFRRMVDGGTFFPNCQLASSSYTASGLATLITGAPPSLHGIVADRWLDADLKPVDARSTHFRTGTLFESVARDPRNRVFICGSGPGVSLLSGLPGVRTSTFAAASPAKWIGAQWTAANAAPGAKPLRAIDSDAVYAASPFSLANDFTSLRETILRERCGAGPGLDLIALSLGSLGALGLETGASSPLMRDLVMHCDKQVSALLDLLDDRPGRANYSVVFTAAHGLDDAGPDDPLINTAAITALPHVRAWLPPFVYLEKPDRTWAEQVRATMFYASGGASSWRGDWLERASNSFCDPRSGDVMLGFVPHARETAGVIASGSLYNYDTRIPLLFYGAPFRSATIDDEIRAADVAPTLARVLGIAPPSSSTGRVLPVRAAR